MASYIFCLFGTGGDIFPCIPVAKELSARGHKVTILANPYFKDVLERNLLTFVPIGDEHTYLCSIRDPRHWASNGIIWCLQNYLGQSIAPTYKKIEAMLDENPIILATPNAFGAQFAAQEFGIRLYSIIYSPTFLVTEDRFPYPFNKIFPKIIPKSIRQGILSLSDKYLGDRRMVPALNVWRKQLDLPPLKNYLAMLKPNNALALFPCWFDDLAALANNNVRQGNFVFYHCDESKSLPDKLEAFLGNGSPPLVFTFGTGVAHVKETFEIALTALEGTQHRAIFLSQFTQNIPKALPENVLALDYADLASLLPRTALIVHHGGIGTTAQAMRAGVPQLILPITYDQPDNGYRIQQLGLGDMLYKVRLEPTILRVTIAKILSGISRQLLNETRERLSGTGGEQFVAQICEEFDL